MDLPVCVTVHKQFIIPGLQLAMGTTHVTKIYQRRAVSLIITLQLLIYSSDKDPQHTYSHSSSSHPPSKHPNPPSNWAILDQSNGTSSLRNNQSSRMGLYLHIHSSLERSACFDLNPLKRILTIDPQACRRGNTGGDSRCRRRCKGRSRTIFSQRTGISITTSGGCCYASEGEEKGDWFGDVHGMGCLSPFCWYVPDDDCSDNRSVFLYSQLNIPPPRMSQSTVQ
ncbi:hypothetical protein ETB97_001502 [Aspergillus alliaceus]|uniref:Uncharacterized protein n=1 Tax=Petromyces alliaceus TaxID=209559 RepID=A0A8H6AF32_PETAA|nr:hypothetical protein ETB97_001502 [Aspergillus burnettii]